MQIEMEALDLLALTPRHATRINYSMHDRREAVATQGYGLLSHV